MAGITSPTFVGRAVELSKLDDALDAAAEGRSAIALIGGDAGVGKSRLLATWNERARERGARVVSGGCLDLGEGGPAYVGCPGVPRPAGPARSGRRRVLVGSDRATLGRVIPELLGRTETDDDREPFTPIAQTRLFDRIASVLGRASADAPLVLELEDIHWADPSTRAMLVYVAANATSGRLLIVATFRAEEAGVEPVTSMLRQLGRHPRCTSLDLLPFDADELGEQLRGILGQALTSGLLAAVHARSEGNALFAEELIASGDPAANLPSSIGAALLSRTAGLSPEARLALRVACVAGRTASYDLLQSVTALPSDRLELALHEVARVSILEPEHDGEGYRFRHALLREALYRDTLPGERRRLHAAVAEALEAGVERRPDDPELASELAYHWFETKEFDRALRASIAAGDAAVRLPAYAEALHHYERVLALWDKAPLAHTDLRHVDVLERASRTANLAGEPEATVAHAARALEELDVTDDTILRVRLLDEVWDALGGLIRNEEAIETARRLGEIDAVGLPVREQIIVLDARTWALRGDGDVAASRVAATELLRLVDGIHAPEWKGEAHLRLAGILLEDRDFAGAIGEAQRASTFAAIAGDAETEVRALTVIYLAFEEAGQYEMAVAAARAARAYADQVGLSEWEGTSATMSESLALLQLGRIDASAQLIEAAFVDPPANPAVLIQFHLLAAEVAIIRGAYKDAATHLEAARDPGAPAQETGRGWLAIVRAQLAIAEGRLKDVRLIVASTAPRLASARRGGHSGASGSGAWSRSGLDAEASRVEVARAAGNEKAIDEARVVANRLLGHVDEARRQMDESGIPDTGVVRGDEALFQGHLARIDGRDDPSLWAGAAEAFPPRSVRALSARYRQAEAMLAVREPREVVAAVVKDAHACAVDIGSPPLAGRFEALARRARIDLHSVPRLAPAGEVAVPSDEQSVPGAAALRGRGLSDREIEVLALVAAGFSNRDIGARLFITDKTASAHVSHILVKLNVTSRTEAATIGVRLGLPDVDRPDRRSD